MKHTHEKVFVTLLILIIAGSAIYVSATGYTIGSSSHETLHADTIRGKTGNTVNVDDDLCLYGDCINAWPVGGAGATGGLTQNSCFWGPYSDSPFYGEGNQALCPDGHYVAGVQVRDRDSGGYCASCAGDVRPYCCAGPTTVGSFPVCSDQEILRYNGGIGVWECSTAGSGGGSGGSGSGGSGTFVPLGGSGVTIATSGSGVGASAYDLTSHIGSDVPSAVLVKGMTQISSIAAGGNNYAQVRAFAPSDSANLPDANRHGSRSGDARLIAGVSRYSGSGTTGIYDTDHNHAIVPVEFIGGAYRIGYDLVSGGTGTEYTELTLVGYFVESAGGSGGAIGTVNKVFSGRTTTSFANGASFSTQVGVTFPETCSNPAISVQSMSDSILCLPAGSADLHAYAGGVTSSGFNAYLSNECSGGAYEPGASGDPHHIDWIAVCDETIDIAGSGTSLPTCADGEVLKYNTGTSAWECGTDDTAGTPTGLVLGGGTVTPSATCDWLWGVAFCNPPFGIGCTQGSNQLISSSAQGAAYLCIT